MKESFRLLLYNIRYGTGSGWKFHTPLPFSGYLKKTQKNTQEITEFIKFVNPDLVGLVEVDGGSRRAEGVSQAKQIANGLEHYFSFKSKYNKTLLSHIPIVRKQGNAFLAKNRIISQRYLYFERGIKRLVIEVELDHMIFFIVHLSIFAKRRKDQLIELGNLVNNCKKPVIVCGDFNVFYGSRELNEFLAITRLRSANLSNVFTFPSRKPMWELDYIFHSTSITIDHMEVPRIRLSDHLPLICDFTLTGKG